MALGYGVTPYDAAYIVVAQRHSATLCTADERLLSNTKIQRLGIVAHIRDYQVRRGLG